jgi:hypothetical protein
MIQQSNVPSQVMQTNEIKFYHYTPNDNNFYHVICQIVRGSIPDDNDYDHGFFYYGTFGSTINYFVKCQLFSHSLIINILNKEIYGMNIEMNNFERKKSLSLDQKLNLERDLIRILPFYFMQNHLRETRMGSNREMRMDSNINLNPLHERNTEQMISIDGNQNNFGNENGFYQNGVVDYTCNVTQPQQQIDSNNITNFNTNSFHRSIGNNVMVVSMDDNQNNVNEFGDYVHNVIRPPKHVEFDNMSQTERVMRPVYTNTSSSNENIEDNLMTTQMTSMVDNQKICLPHQNRGEDTQQADYNNFPRQIPERETIPDYNRNINSPQNDIIAHDVSITDINFDHRDTRNASPQQQADLYTPDERITTQDVLITNFNRNYDDNVMLYNDNQNV